MESGVEIKGTDGWEITKRLDGRVGGLCPGSEVVIGEKEIAFI